MKFAVSVVVMLALALGVQSSVLPWGAHHWGGHIAAPAAISLSHGPAWASHASVAVHHAAPVHHAAWAAPHWGAPHAAVAVHAAPLHHGGWAAPHWGAPHAAVAVHAAPIHHIAHEGQYVAKTRGAIHTAPLAGHINSASSINLEPAPGTL